MADKNGKPACKYGEKCYQKNEAHLDRFSHPEKGGLSAAAENDDKAPSPHHLNNRMQSVSPNGSPPNKKLKPNGSPSTDTGSTANGKKIPEPTTRVTRSTSKSPGKSPDKKTSPGISPKINPKKSPIDKNKTTPTKSPKNSADSVEKSPPVAAMASCSTTRLNNGPNQKHDIDFINQVYDKETRYSQRAEYKELLKEPAEFIKSKFLTDMPADFFALWEFCKSMAKDAQSPENVFKKFGLQLVGPYDVLAGKFNNAEMFEPGDYLRHWRFFYDTPEFQTILVKENSTLHYGYWRDSPDKNCLIARNDASKGCEIVHIADNVISAVMYYLEKDAQLSPFNRPAVQAMKKSLEQFAQRQDIPLDTFSAKLKARNNRTVSKTLHKGGLIVPYDRQTTVGYRPINESDANLIKMMNKFSIAEGDEDMVASIMDKLQPLITAASIAVDESDFGNSVELGIAFFCSGAKELHGALLQLLVNGYSMINKPQFIAIIKAHLEERKPGFNLSILNGLSNSDE